MPNVNVVIMLKDSSIAILKEAMMSGPKHSQISAHITYPALIAIQQRDSALAIIMTTLPHINALNYQLNYMLN